MNTHFKKNKVPPLRKSSKGNVLKKTLEKCRRCGAKCCRYWSLQVAEPGSDLEWENWRWLLLHRGTKIYLEEGVWHLLAENRCRNLKRDNTCRDYANRPALCRLYGKTRCDFDHPAWQICLASVKDLEKYRALCLKRREEERLKKTSKKKW